ncbi:uncharacterized protein YALI1_A01736g [Yarrowia lipolytica]|uniref:Uncharacterized protein n=1 Tax=Yarrowia lipolytica TaxID=4952 RepID=A0A1D8N3C3_YARLL|nr:hypothetical protein YALI1_A01736g [Yarrowia lipolytica]
MIITQLLSSISTQVTHHIAQAFPPNVLVGVSTTGTQVECGGASGSVFFGGRPLFLGLSTSEQLTVFEIFLSGVSGQGYSYRLLALAQPRKFRWKQHKISRVA